MAQSNPSVRHRVELEAIERMTTVRDLLDHLLVGHELVSGDLLFRLGHILEVAGRRLEVVENEIEKAL